MQHGHFNQHPVSTLGFQRYPPIVLNACYCYAVMNGVRFRPRGNLLSVHEQDLSSFLASNHVHNQLLLEVMVC
jgi:hypothetical protein